MWHLNLWVRHSTTGYERSSMLVGADPRTGSVGRRGSAGLTQAGRLGSSWGNSARIGTTLSELTRQTVAYPEWCDRRYDPVPGWSSGESGACVRAAITAGRSQKARRETIVPSSSVL